MMLLSKTERQLIFKKESWSFKRVGYLFNCWFQWVVPIPLSTKIVTLMDYDLKRKYSPTHTGEYGKYWAERGAKSCTAKERPLHSALFFQRANKEANVAAEARYGVRVMIAEKRENQLLKARFQEATCKYRLPWKRPMQHWQLCKRSDVRDCWAGTDKNNTICQQLLNELWLEIYHG